MANSKYTVDELYNEYIKTYNNIKSKYGATYAVSNTKESFMQKLNIRKNEYLSAGQNPPSYKKLAQEVARQTAYGYSRAQAKTYLEVTKSRIIKNNPRLSEKELNRLIKKETNSIMKLRTSGLSMEDEDYVMAEYNRMKKEGYSKSEIRVALAAIYGSK